MFASGKIVPELVSLDDKVLISFVHLLVLFIRKDKFIPAGAAFLEFEPLLESLLT
jgi:hypothetical protein